MIRIKGESQTVVWDLKDQMRISELLVTKETE